MKKILLITMLAILASCTVQKSGTILLVNKKEDCPMKLTSVIPRAGQNRFTKQFQQADSMFNEKYKLR